MKNKYRRLKKQKTKATIAHAATLEFENREKLLILFSDASDTHTLLTHIRERRSDGSFGIFFKKASSP